MFESLDSVTLLDAYKTVKKWKDSGAMPVEIALAHCHEISYLHAITMKQAELEMHQERSEKDPPEGPDFSPQNTRKGWGKRARETIREGTFFPFFLKILDYLRCSGTVH